MPSSPLFLFPVGPAPHLGLPRVPPAHPHTHHSFSRGPGASGSPPPRLRAQPARPSATPPIPCPTCFSRAALAQSAGAAHADFPPSTQPRRCASPRPRPTCACSLLPCARTDARRRAPSLAGVPHRAARPSSLTAYTHDVRSTAMSPLPLLLPSHVRPPCSHDLRPTLSRSRERCK
jgi:hypothetical protein